MYSYTAFPTIDMKRTGQRIEQIRKERGFSVRDVQMYFGFEYPQAVYKWQWGESLPSVDNLFALARLFGVNMQDLLVEYDREVSPFWQRRPLGFIGRGNRGRPADDHAPPSRTPRAPRRLRPAPGRRPDPAPWLPRSPDGAGCGRLSQPWAEAA